MDKRVGKMDKRVGKFGNDRTTFVRPKQDIRGNSIPGDEPLHRTRGIGGEYFVVLPLMDNDYVTMDKIIDELRSELKIVVKPVKGNKGSKPE